jgi:hypothetical protein
MNSTEVHIFLNCLPNPKEGVEIKGLNQVLVFVVVDDDDEILLRENVN